MRREMVARSASLALALLALSSGELYAQVAPEIRLQAANASLSEGFNMLRSARELADGRLLVVDVGDNRVALIDWRTSRVSNIGRTGEGPGEFQSPVSLIWLPGDSTVLVDIHNRWLILAGDRIVETVTPDKNLNQALGPRLARGDAAGHLLATPMNMTAYMRRADEVQAGRTSHTTDSMLLLRAERSSGRIDTIARLQSGSLGWKKATPRGGRSGLVWILRNPLEADEQAVLFPDGWIAIARQKPYRVEWRRPDGSWIRGAPVAVQPARVDDREKRAVIKREFPGQAEVPFEPADYPEWPATLPPFLSRWRSLFAEPAGRLVIWRTPSAASVANRYDVFDRTGKLVQFFTLSASETLLGFGAHSAYVVVTDADDVQLLRRHPWP